MGVNVADQCDISGRNDRGTTRSTTSIRSDDDDGSGCGRRRVPRLFFFFFFLGFFIVAFCIGTKLAALPPLVPSVVRAIGAHFGVGWRHGHGLLLLRLLFLYFPQKIAVTGTIAVVVGGGTRFAFVVRDVVIVRFFVLVLHCSLIGVGIDRVSSFPLMLLLLLLTVAAPSRGE